jgi:hypothetical protein
MMETTPQDVDHPGTGHLMLVTESKKAAAPIVSFLR